MSYPGSCCESFEFPEVAWLPSPSILLIKLQAEKLTNTHKQGESKAKHRYENITEPGVQASHVGSALALPSPLMPRVGRRWDRHLTNPIDVTVEIPPITSETTPSTGEPALLEILE